MDSLLNSKRLGSSVITVDSNEIIQLTNTIVGILYTYVSSKLFSSKLKRRFFELKGNTLDIWNTQKSHKTCKKIKNLKKYHRVITGEKIIDENHYYYIKIYSNTKSKILYSVNKDGFDIVYNELVRIIYN
jgi:hypothetical protein